MPEPGDIIGYRKSGRPIHLAAGGAVADVTAWIPEEFSSEVIARVQQMSVIERLARAWPMANTLRHVPRSAGMDVSAIAAGGTYAEDVSLNDEIILVARKIGEGLRLNDEDLKDSSLVDILNTKKLDWATSYAKFLDQACLGVSGAESMPTIPFTSVYKTVRTTDATLSYTADDNYVASASGAAVTYDNLSDVLGRVEVGDYWDPTDAVVIAHPSFKAKLRGIKDDQNMPVFVGGQGGDRGTPDTLFGYEIAWSLGARVHATATANPTGSPLLICGNRNFLYRGDRSGPESALAGPDSGPAFLTDQALMKMRSRRAFKVAHVKAFSVLEDVV